MNYQRLDELMNKASCARITVVGDFCLDKYLYIDPAKDEPSLETGLTAYQVIRKGRFPGGAGSVTNNLRALTARVSCIGVIGDDGEGWELVRELNRRGAGTELMVTDPDRCTSTYTKPMRGSDKGGWTEMSRLDFKNFAPMSAKTQAHVIENIRKAAENSDALLVLDQFVEENCGVINANVKKALSQIAEKYPKLIIYADSRAFIHTFKDVIIKCNNYEVVKAVEPDYQGKPDLETVRRCGLKLFEKNGRTVFVTLGPNGMAVFSKGGFRHVPAVECEGPFDFCGAGDSASSGIVMALSLGALPEEAALLGNMVASITIQQIGVTGTATPAQMRARFKESVENNPNHHVNN